MKYVKMILTMRVAASAICLSMIMAISGCLDDVSVPKVDPIAYVTLYHGSPNGPDLDIEVDGNQTNAVRFKYADYTTYAAFFVGERNFGFGPYSSSSIDVEGDFTLEENKFYSLFIAGEYADAELVFINDNTTLPAVGKAKIRVINLSPDAGDIDLKILGAADNLASDISFKENTAFIEVPSGLTDFEVRASDDDELLASVPDAQLNEGWIYTIIIRGYETPPDGNTNVLAAQIVRN